MPPSRSLSQLLRVLPVGQSDERGDIRIGLLSLEIYRDGIVAHTAVELAHGEFGLAKNTLRGVELDLAVSDDTGTRYRVWPGGGGGSERSWRCDYLAEPTVPERATALDLHVKSVRVGQTPPLAAREWQGPWEFRIAVIGS